MDTDGDGAYNITLIKSGNRWEYYFDVADPSATYYISEVMGSAAGNYTLTDEDGNENTDGYVMMENGQEVVLYNTEDGYGTPPITA